MRRCSLTSVALLAVLAAFAGCGGTGGSSSGDQSAGSTAPADVSAPSGGAAAHDESSGSGSSSADQGSSTGSSAASDTAKAAKDLAAVAGDPSLADQFQTTLESLKRRCRESPHQLAALVYGTEQVLKGDGVNESYATVLSSLDTAVPSNARRFDCRGALAALVVLREKG